MSRIKTAIGCQRGGQSDQFLQVGGAAGGVFQAAGKAPGALIQSLFDQFCHPLTLVRGGRAHIRSFDRGPDHVVSDQGDNIDRDPLRFVFVFQLSQVGPIDFVVGHKRGEMIQDLRFGKARDRKETGSAVAGAFGGHPQVDGAFRQGIDQQGCIRMAVDFDKTGTEHLSVGNDNMIGILSCKIPDLGDFAVGYGQVGFKPRGAAAVDDTGVADDRIKHG